MVFKVVRLIVISILLFYRVGREKGGGEERVLDNWSRLIERIICEVAFKILCVCF